MCACARVCHGAGMMDNFNTREIQGGISTREIIQGEIQQREVSWERGFRVGSYRRVFRRNVDRVGNLERQMRVLSGLLALASMIDEEEPQQKRQRRMNQVVVGCQRSGRDRQKDGC